MREFSLPALAEIPATANLASAVFRRAAEQPQAVMLRRPGPAGSWQDVTASQFSDEVVALAKGLVAAGIEAGDRVALMSHTRYEWTLIDYAIWTAGAVTVPVYETSSAEQAEWILSDSGARACFAETAAYEDMIGGFRDRVPGAVARVADRSRPRRAARGGRGRRRRGHRRARRRGQGVRPGHDHLHLGHHRAAQGLRADPREPARRRAQRVPRTAGHRRRDRRTPARCCSCRSRTSSPGSSRWAASRAGSCSGTAGT